MLVLFFSINALCVTLKSPKLSHSLLLVIAFQKVCAKTSGRNQPLVISQRVYALLYEDLYN